MTPNNHYSGRTASLTYSTNIGTEYFKHKNIYKLNQIITEYGLTISVQKTKSMTFKGRDPVRTKTVIDNKIVEQVNSFNYLGNMI